MKWSFLSKSLVIGQPKGRPYDMFVSEIVGSRPGKTLLITGGMDGDEYSGMEAAYRLIGKYQAGDFAGRLIVIPIANIGGFDGECSWNPEDKRFPKHIFPGDANGSPTARLVHWLATNHVARADVWHDLHAGAITEGLRPFVWLYETGVPDVDAFSQELIARMDADRFVFERTGMTSKAGQLARAGRAYILAESGERGIRDEESIARHVMWVETTMQTLGMIEGASARASVPTVFTQVVYDRAPFEGIWRPILPSRGYNVPSMPDVVRRGDVIGTCLRVDGSGVREIRASANGTPLWWKETMRMKNNEMLVAIGLE